MFRNDEKGYTKTLSSVAKVLKGRLNKPTKPSISLQIVPALCGPINAHQAWVVVSPEIKKACRNAKLTLTTSGLNINDKGGAHTWVFIYFSPAYHVMVMHTLKSLWIGNKLLGLFEVA